jgi:hypothetical protein
MGESKWTDTPGASPVTVRRLQSRRKVSPEELKPNLESFVRPLSAAEFAAGVFGKQALLSRGPRSVCSLVDAARKLSLDAFAAEFPQASVTRFSTDADGGELVEQISAREAAAASVQESTATLYLVGLQRSYPGLSLWSEGIAMPLELAHRNGLGEVSAVMSDAGSGFRAHFDKNENFVVQIRGCKRWRLAHNSHVAAPTANYLEDALGEVGLYSERLEEPVPEAATDEVVLEPGDVLYVPRGMWHETQALEGGSVSLSFTMITMTWADALLPALRRVLMRRTAWRDHARGVDWPAGSTAREALQALLSELPGAAGELSVAELMPEPLRERGLPEPGTRFRVNRLSTLSVSRKEVGVELTVTAASLGHVRAVQFELAAAELEALQWIFQRGESFAVQELLGDQESAARSRLEALVLSLERAGHLRRDPV